jgi:hypothetical protein
MHSQKLFCLDKITGIMMISTNAVLFRMHRIIGLNDDLFEDLVKVKLFIETSNFLISTRFRLDSQNKEKA